MIIRFIETLPGWTIKGRPHDDVLSKLHQYHPTTSQFRWIHRTDAILIYERNIFSLPHRTATTGPSSHPSDHLDVDRRSSSTASMRPQDDKGQWWHRKTAPEGARQNLSIGAPYQMWSMMADWTPLQKPTRPTMALMSLLLTQPSPTQPEEGASVCFRNEAAQAGTSIRMGPRRGPPEWK